jgi:hypothetical protein
VGQGLPIETSDIAATIKLRSAGSLDPVIRNVSMMSGYSCSFISEKNVLYLSTSIPIDTNCRRNSSLPIVDGGPFEQLLARV